MEVHMALNHGVKNLEPVASNLQLCNDLAKLRKVASISRLLQVLTILSPERRGVGCQPTWQ